MPLHRVDSLTLGVPDVGAAASFYEDFGLTRTDLGTSNTTTFATREGGDQLSIVQSRRRRLVEATFAADDADDVSRICSALQALGVVAEITTDITGAVTGCVATEVVTDVRVRVTIAPRLIQKPVPAPVYNGPGRSDRVNARAAGILREARVMPRRLGHFVLGTTDFERTTTFFIEGLGFRVSDVIRDVGVFLRCSTDHHNVLVQRAPVPFLHHTSWQVEDIDEVGRGAMDMVSTDPGRHVWGLGRHYAGSNFFYYLKDPAGNFAEYHSDMDCIPEDAIWTPEELEGAKGLFSWGPPPPPSFIDPEDLAELMVSEHAG